MPRRISDIVGERVLAAIDSLEILDRLKEDIQWDVTPVLLARPGSEPTLGFVVAISVPVPGAIEEDYVLYSAPMEDPHAGPGAYLAMVAALYERCAAEADQIRQENATLANGHRESPGGLILP